MSNSISSSNYDKDSIKIYTVDTTTGSTTSQITSSNNFYRYSTVKANFDTKMEETKSYCYAIRFQSINATSSSNWSDKITVKINGNEKSNYQFLKSAINFTVNKPGYITVIISSFMGVGTKMFDLFKIDRNSDNSISKVTQINKIYGVADSGTYYYDDTSKSSNLLFNFENTHSLSTKSLYYFEIPVNAGDYAICKYSTTEGTDTSTGYLNYLDIGANAGSGSETTSNTVYRTKVLELLKQINSTFTYPSGVYVTDLTTTDIINDKKTYCVQLGKTYSGTATMDVSSDTATTSLTTASTDTGVAYFDDSLTVNENGTAITIDNAISESKVETQAIRLAYYDHYYGDETDELYVYTMETSSSSEIPTTFTGYTGSKANDGTYTLSTGGKEKFYDDSGAEAEVSSISPSEYDISSVNTSTPVISLRNVDTFTYLPTGSIGTDQYYGSVFNETNPTPSGYNITATAISGKEVEEISRNSNYTINFA